MKIESILNDLDTLLPRQNKNQIVENRANHVITSAINIMYMIEESYDIETANKLQRKFLNAIRTGNIDKFTNAIKRVDNKKYLK